MENEALEKVIDDLGNVLTKLKALCYDKGEKPASSLKELRGQVEKRNKKDEEEGEEK